MANIKTVVLKALADALATATGVTCLPRQADADAKVAYPYVVVLPGDLTFNAFDADEIDTTVDGSSTLVCVGDFEGTVEIRVCTTYADARAEIEDTIVRSFMRGPASGNLNLVLPAFAIDGVTFPNSLIASFDLDDVTWNEERVFTAPRYSAITVEVMFSALVAASYYDIETLQLAIAEDLNAAVPDETVTIADDGTITRV